MTQFKHCYSFLDLNTAYCTILYIKKDTFVDTIKMKDFFEKLKKNCYDWSYRLLSNFSSYQNYVKKETNKNTKHHHLSLHKLVLNTIKMFFKRKEIMLSVRSTFYSLKISNTCYVLLYTRHMAAFYFYKALKVWDGCLCHFCL